MALDGNVIKQVSERLGQYVYLLVDPRDSRPFYVGKGRGVRMLAHGHGHGHEASDDGELAEHAKDSRIREIRAAGLEHELWIVRYGLNNAEYTAVEAAVIDVLGSFPADTGYQWPVSAAGTPSRADQPSP